MRTDTEILIAAQMARKMFDELKLLNIHETIDFYEDGDRVVSMQFSFSDTFLEMFPRAVTIDYDDEYDCVRYKDKKNKILCLALKKKTPEA